MSARQVDRGTRVDLRLVPVAGAAWLGAWWSGSEASWWWGLLVASVPLLLALLWRNATLLAIGLAVAGYLVIGSIHSHALTESPLGRAAQAGGRVEIGGQVAGDPRVFENFGSETVYVTVRVDQLAGRGVAPQLARVEVEGAEVAEVSRWQVGQRVSFSARISPGRLGEAAGLREIRQPTVLARPGLLAGAVNRLRRGLHKVMVGAPIKQAAVVPALVVGDVSAIDDRLREDFKRTGLAHLSAVSGANLALLLAAVGFAARLLGVRGALLRALVIVTTLGFVVLCRSEPSVIRAAAMGLVALGSLGCNHDKAAGLRNLSVACLALFAWQPWLSHSVGLALSVLATLGIIWWVPSWADSLAEWLPRPIALLVSVPLAAQVATQPVITHISGQISIISVVANLIAGPFVGPATVFGFLACLTSWLPIPIAMISGRLAGFATQPIIWVAEAASALPGATLPLTATPAAITGLVLVTVTATWWMPHLLRRPYVCAAIVGVALAWLCVGTGLLPRS